MCRVILFILFLTVTKANLIVYEECLNLNYKVYPIQYDLTIIPNTCYYKPYYLCELSITIIANTPNMYKIELDYRDLEIKSNSVKVLDGNRDIVNRLRPYELDNMNGKLRIYLRETLKVYDVNNGRYNYIIKLTFTKTMREDSDGAFMVKYDSKHVNKNSLYMTRLSPNKAKYFFPCFDNPRFESVFNFKVHAEYQYTNTILVVAEEFKRMMTNYNKTIIEYLPTPNVYLNQVGFVYSQFTTIMTKSKYTNDMITLWAPQNQRNNYEYILNFGISIINLIHEYSTINRPLLHGPINIVAVPKNLDGYEIGSWNLLTNGFHRLQNIELLTSIKQKERMSFELAQQLSRIWLGNPGESQRTRWKEEWFKEGMATYLAYYFMTQYNQGEQIHTRYPLDIYGIQMKHKAMAVDWHHSTHLATFNSSLAIEIPARYKELVTMKTGAILWILENWLESKRFHKSVVNYINSRRGCFISIQDFTTTIAQDSIECFNQFFDFFTRSKIFKSWFHQSGYPVINVHVFRDRTPNAIQLKQRKFSFFNEKCKYSDYFIPISYVIQNSRDCYNCQRPRFTIGKQTYTFEEKLQGGWIILNKNASGYYRVNYDAVTWKLIARTLKENFNLIPELNRAQIVNDVLALYAAGDLDIDLAMEILDYLDIERSHVVWDSVISGFELLKIDGARCNMSLALFNEWEEFLGRMVSGIYKELVIKEDLNSVRLLRSKIIEFACSLNYEPCLKYARFIYDQDVQGKKWLDPDSRVACYYVMENDSRGVNIHTLSSLFEKEDKIIAEHKMRDNKRFLIRIPRGQRRPVTTETIIIEATTAVAEKFQQYRDSSITNKASIIMSLILFCTTIIIRSDFSIAR